MDKIPNETSDTATAPQQQSTKKRVIKLTIAVLVLLGAALGIWRYFHNAALYPSTNDAYVHAHILYIAPQVSGQVEQVFVKNLQPVQKNQLLFEIKPRKFQVAFNQAEAELALAERGVKTSYAAIQVATANVAERKAELKDVEGRTKRTLDLARKGFASKQTALNATTQLANAQAALAHAKTALIQATVAAGKQGSTNAETLKAKADVEQAQLNLSYTKIRAPADGTIINFQLRPNSWVSQGQPAFALIEQNQWWVDANYKETILNSIKMGMPATIKIDMYPNKVFKGYVGEISRGSGAVFSLLPPENATGNWVKVTRRFPVRIYFLTAVDRDNLRVGASATVTVNTTQHTSP